MPLAALDPTTTPRLVIHYTANQVEHTAIARLPIGGTSSTAVSMYNTLAPAMAAFLWTSDSVLGADFIDAGTNIGNPLAVSADAGDVNITPDADHEPNFLSFTGRGPDGRKTKFGLYCPGLDLSASGYRDNTPDSLEATLRAALIAAGVRTISGSLPVWHNYVNYGSNAYWQRKKRVS